MARVWYLGRESSSSMALQSQASICLCRPIITCESTDKHMATIGGDSSPSTLPRMGTSKFVQQTGLRLCHTLALSRPATFSLHPLRITVRYLHQEPNPLAFISADFLNLEPALSRRQRDTTARRRRILSSAGIMRQLRPARVSRNLP